MDSVVSVRFRSFEQSVSQALDELGAREFLAGQGAGQRAVLLKPNLVTASPHPVTTHPDMIEAVVLYVRSCGIEDIIIAEGTGEADKDTAEVFALLGYDRLSRRLSVPLMDLNEAELVLRENPACPVFPRMHLPLVAFERLIVSLPVLKAHSLAGITGTLKNMMGLAPPKFYSGRYGSWKKALFHGRMQQSIRDLNRYVLPQLTIMDASMGLADFHLGGRICDPPVGKILAAFDAHALDREAARLLGIDPTSVAHLWP